jgi:hypothetical protein
LGLQIHCSLSYEVALSFWNEYKLEFSMKSDNYHITCMKIFVLCHIFCNVVISTF